MALSPEFWIWDVLTACAVQSSYHTNSVKGHDEPPPAPDANSSTDFSFQSDNRTWTPAASASLPRCSSSWVPLSVYQRLMENDMEVEVLNPGHVKFSSAWSGHVGVGEMVNIQ
ncbi:hypothetical protein P7K49_009066 [Saguinus oedipus]|uniref:Uncharacterized protein n=1 Tax=Saguinus oedipus TaxID=9490 RepID=A0ABQ9VZH5_SAGOE|nr:hypothetical protein P7K49_009066 [Saguinus oedipus]